MTCEDVKADMAEYLDGLLPVEQKAAYEKHLQSCAHCRRLAVETKNAVEWLQQAEELVPPPNLRSSVLKTLQQEKQRRRRLAPGTVQMIAAAAVFVLLIIGNLLPGSDNYYIGTRSSGSPAAYESYGQEVDVRAAAENEDSLLKTADESAQEGLADTGRQNQTDRLRPTIIPLRTAANLLLSTVLICLLLLARKKRRELLP
ncbi:MAG: anti-sigma factor family protein [Dethiobacteraceae bacterium]|jgi:hypothetical protein